MTIYRRKATTTASRSTWVMLEIKDLTTPEPQQINPNDLFTVINSMLLPASSATNFSATEVLTEYLVNILELSSSPYAQMADGATLVLRNLLTIPLYLCNSVALTGASSMSTVQSQLPAENQLFGSNILAATRAVPALWTVYSYAGMAGAIVLTVVASTIYLSWQGHRIEPSEFPIANFVGLTSVYTQASNGHRVLIRHSEIFPKSNNGQETHQRQKTRQILSRAAEVRICTSEEEPREN
jgi:hypothetical protein